MRLALTAAAFICSVLVPGLIRLWRARRWGLPVSLTVDPENPDPAEIAGCFAQIAVRLDARPERMRLAIRGRTARHLAISLDFRPDGRMAVSVDGRGRHVFDLRRRWIPEHPVPLDLARRRLYIDPVDGNRFRVMESPPFSVPAVVYAACSLLATAALVWVVPEALGAALGLALGCAAAANAARA